MRFCFFDKEPPYVAASYGTDDFGNEYALVVNVTIGETGRYFIGPYRPIIDPLAFISFQCDVRTLVNAVNFTHQEF